MSTTAASMRFAWASLRSQGAPLALTILAIALGVALVCAMDSANRAVGQAFSEVLDTMAGRVSLEVAAPEDGLFPEDVAETVTAIDGVELAVPVVVATAFVGDDSGELVSVLGVDVANESALRAYSTGDETAVGVDDPLAFLSQADSIAIPRLLADRRGLTLGSALALETPAGRKAFTVRGILEAEGVGQVYGGSLVVMDVMAAEAVFTRPGFVTRVDVVVPPEQDLEAVRRAILARLPPGLRVERPAQRAADVHRTIRSMHVLLDCVAAASILVGLVIVVSRLSTLFERREWQLGAMRALGVSQRGLWRTLMAEAAILAMAGVALGIPLGIALGRVLVPIVAQTTAVNFRLVVPAGAWSVRPASIAIATLLGFAGAFVAAALPARRSARRALVATMQDRGVEAESGDGSRRWWPAALLLGTIVLLVLLQAGLDLPVLGIVATVLLIVATGLAARPLVLFLGQQLVPVLGDAVGPTTRLAASTATTASRRLGSMGATLGIGLGTALWLATMGLSFERSLVDALGHVITADLVVGSANVVGGREPVPIDEAVLSELSRIPGVAAVASWRIRDWQFAGGPIAIDSFDSDYFRRGDMGEWRLVGPHATDAWKQVAAGTATVVSTSFATNLGVHVGDVVSLDTPTGPLALPVVGTTVAFTSPRGTMFVSRELYRRAWNDPQITQALVRIAPGASADDVRRAIMHSLGRAYRLEILSPRGLLDFWIAQVRRGFAAVPVLSGLVLLLVLIALGDALAASVSERTRELGTLRALGIPAARVRRMVMLEALLTGVAGIVLASILGLALGVLWVRDTFPLLLGWALEFHFPALQLVFVVAATIALCLAAGALPATRAARLPAAEALRYE